MRRDRVTCIAQLGTFVQPITSFTTNADGSILAVAVEQGREIAIWDAPTGTILNRISLSGFVDDDVISLALSDDGCFLAATFRNASNVCVWAFTGEMIWTCNGDAPFKRSVCFLPNSSFLVMISHDTHLEIVDVMSQEVVGILPGIGTKKPGLLSKMNTFYRVLCSPDGNQIALNATRTGHLICLWDIQQEQERVTCLDQRYFLWNEEEYGRCIRYFPQTKRLYHVTKKAIEGYDTQTGQCVQRIAVPGIIPLHFCFSADGRLLFFSDDEGVISVWDMQTSTLLFQFDSVEQVFPSYLFYESRLRDLVWLAQSQMLATVGQKTTDSSGIATIKLWKIT